jgi:outer membrane protein OmpU
MTNLKKVGLTALAGTLATITAVQAADVSISGVARMEYETKSSKTSATVEDSTELFTQNTSITFSASGEMDNGMTGSWKHTHSGTGVFSSLVTLDMGDMGALYMDQGNAGRQGITTIQDKYQMLVNKYGMILVPVLMVELNKVLLILVAEMYSVMQ